MRAIDADELKKKAFGKRGGLIHTADIDAMPTIEERKTGKWIYGENKYGHDGWQCDQCGHWILWDYHVSMEDTERDLPKYCPSCGARMVQEGEDNDG